MDVTVDLLGTARISAKRPKASLHLPDGATGRDVVVALAREIPALKGTVVDPQKRELIYPQLLGNGAGKTIRDLDAPLEAGTGQQLFVFQEPC